MKKDSSPDQKESSPPKPIEPPKPPVVKTWLVLSPGYSQAQRVEAERMYLSAGALTFMSGDDITRAFGAGHWVDVRLEA